MRFRTARWKSSFSITPRARARPGFITTGKFSARTVPVSSSSSSGGSGRRSPGLTLAGIRRARRAERVVHQRVVVEQRQEHDDALGDRRAQTIVQTTPSVLVPAVDRLQLMPSREPGIAVGFGDAKRHVLGGEVAIEIRVVGMREFLRVLGKPQRPRTLRTVLVVVVRRHDDDFGRLLEHRRQPADVLLDQRRLEDVAIHLRERRVAVGDPAQEDHELQQVGVCLLPERFLRLAEQVVQQRCDGVRDSVRVEIVVQRVVAIVRSRDRSRRSPVPARPASECPCTCLQKSPFTSSTRPPIL